MSIFQRISTLVRANLNHLISKAEDPEKMLNQMVFDMRRQFAEAKNQVAVSIADEKRLFKQYENEKNLANEWERKAMQAVNAGKDDLAKEALLRKQEYDERANEYYKHWEAQKQATEKLKDALSKLNAKIEEAKRKKNLLIARAKRAEAQQTIHSAMSTVSDTSAFDTFERMAEKVEVIEARAEAEVELGAELEAGDELEKKFKELPATSSTADDALLKLKAKMGLLPPKEETKTLPEGK